MRMPLAVLSQFFVLHGARSQGARLLAAVSLLLAVSSSPARADDEGEGRKRFQRGQELFLEGKYLEAAQAFESGYAVAPRNGFLINIAHSYRRAGDLAKAKSFYVKLLELEPNTPQRAEVEGNLRSIDDALSMQNLPTPPPPKKAAPAVPNPDEAFRRRVAAESESSAVASKKNEAEDDGSVFGRAWFWALVLSTVAVGAIVSIAVLKPDDGCNADRCVTEGP